MNTEEIKLLAFLIMIFVLFPIVLILNYNRVNKEFEKDLEND